MYGAYKNVWKKSKGHNYETKKGGAIILMRDTSAWHNTYSYKIA